MASESNDAPMPANTPGELRDAITYLNQAAKAAAEVGNDLLRARRHEQMNTLLVQLETVQLEAAFSSPLEKLLARVDLPGGSPPFAVGP